MKKAKVDKYNRAKVTAENMPPRVRHAIRVSKHAEVWHSKVHGWIPRGRTDLQLIEGCIYRVRPPKKVYVHVRGGVAYCDRVPEGVVVKIIDHDNEGHR